MHLINHWKMLIKEIVETIENIAPVALQESYDNAGLIIGNHDLEVEKVMLTVDVTEEVLDEAIEKKCGLIISHHPLIFSGLKKINGKNTIERIIIKAIIHNISIYAAHTNLDNVHNGVNAILAEKLGLKNTRILKSKSELLRKLVTYCPTEYAEQVRKALFDAGAGNIGNYNSCSFNMRGEGSFKASENATPFVGKINELHFEKETRIETIYPYYIEKLIIDSLLKSHPYEEEFLLKIKDLTNANCIKHSGLIGKKIKIVAICGGSGSFLIKDAIAAKADIFITGDIKYHDFFEAENKIIIADIGHFESEQFTKELLYTIITKKFPNFAVLISEKDTNPVHYL